MPVERGTIPPGRQGTGDPDRQDAGTGDPDRHSAGAGAGAGERAVTDPAGMVRALLDVAEVRERVDRRLAGFLSARLASATGATGATGGDPDRLLLEPVADLLLRAGKRLRPAFCYWGWRGAGGADRDEAVAAATALELLHGCALIHDDVMDGSALRRGRPAVHQELAARHAALRWRGGSAAFGIAGAVVAGDMCLVWADEMLRGSGLPADALVRAAPVYDAMRSETIRGQYLDLIMQAEGALRVDDAIAVARAKTAASTTLGPMLFGGTLAGGGEDLLAAYTAYAAPLGLAFQLRDDLIGAFGAPERTGKPSGDDLRDGKCTLLLAEARRRAGRHDAGRIDALLARTGTPAAGTTGAGTGDAVAELRAFIERTGARAYVEAEIARLGALAVAAVDRAPLSGEVARQVLRGLALAVAAADPAADPGAGPGTDPADDPGADPAAGRVTGPGAQTMRANTSATASSGTA